MHAPIKAIEDLRPKLIGLKLLGLIDVTVNAGRVVLVVGGDQRTYRAVHVVEGLVWIDGPVQAPLGVGPHEAVLG